MKLCDSRVLAAMLAVTGAFLVTQGAVFADPVGDGCSDRCQQKSYFIGSPSLVCSTYDPATCINCTFAGRCVDFVGPPLPSCSPQTSLTTVTSYGAGCCTPKCNLDLRSTAEATAPNPNCEISSVVTVNLHLCIDPPPG